MTRNKKTVLSILVSILILLFIFLLPAVKVLSVYNRKNPNQRFYFVSTNGFCISYTHSVNKGRVYDYYTILSDNQLELNETKFVSYGAGIPEPEETENAEFFVTDDGYVITNLHSVLPRLMMAVGIIAAHEVEINGHRYKLTDYFSPQTSLFFEIKRVSLGEYILHKLKPVN